MFLGFTHSKKPGPLLSSRSGSATGLSLTMVNVRVITITMKKVIFLTLLEIQRVPLEKLCLRIKVLGLFIGRDVKVCFRQAARFLIIMSMSIE